MRAPVWGLAGAQKHAPMALNAASHKPGNIQVHFRYANDFTSDLSKIASEKTSPGIRTSPPPTSQEATAATVEASKDDSI